MSCKIKHIFLIILHNSRKICFFNPNAVTLKPELIAAGCPGRLAVVFCRRSGLRQGKTTGKMPASGCKQTGNGTAGTEWENSVVMTDWCLTLRRWRLWAQRKVKPPEIPHSVSGDFSLIAVGHCRAPRCLMAVDGTRGMLSPDDELAHCRDSVAVHFLNDVNAPRRRSLCAERVSVD